MRSIIKKKDKRGIGGILIFFLILFSILVIGFVAAIAFGIFNYASEQITPVMTELGMAGDSNISEYAGYGFGTFNTFLSAAPWLIGFAYIGALIFSVFLALSYTYNPNPIFIGLYVMFIVLLIFFAIIMSNMYEDIYTGTDEIATQLQAQTLTSYMILYSPMILTTIAFITGIFLFAGRRDEGGYSGV